ncbi:hypothetical protein PFISCL1PPCAC_17631 [Pristionchus fissidentatus]|uniref:G protein-coupled receptor n=1 Tax=Pristionchus fissidentatus TaxID=1538716 RepID=A0AAV5W8Z7_9BILA|nr:hypothetical protein PFISCL1PPCAC_17631 [Pristionchus fissidentatus]
MVSSFEPTSAGKVTHTCLKLLGILCFLAALPPLAFLLSKSAKAQLQTYRWFLLAIVLSGVTMDVHISLLISPYPLLPHVSFWGDGWLVYIHPRAILYLLAVALALMYIWLTSLLLAFTYRLHKLIAMRRKTRIVKVAILFSTIGLFNIILTPRNFSNTILLQYPQQREVERIIRQSVPEVSFLFEMPAYIYFVESIGRVKWRYSYLLIVLIGHVLSLNMF